MCLFHTGQYSEALRPFCCPFTLALQGVAPARGLCVIFGPAVSRWGLYYAHCGRLQHEQAKALGARWDVAGKTWYLEHVEDLTPFIRWLPEFKLVAQKKDTDFYDKKKRKRKPKYLRMGFVSIKDYENHKHEKTKSGQTKSVYVPHCGCDVLPWLDCEHTDTAANNAMHEILGLALIPIKF